MLNVNFNRAIGRFLNLLNNKDTPDIITVANSTDVTNITIIITAVINIINTGSSNNNDADTCAAAVCQPSSANNQMAGCSTSRSSV